MKRRDLIKQVEELGAVFLRHGGEHDIYIKGEIKVAIPRSREIPIGTAKQILKKLGA